jgi:hypothetical protein
MSGKFRGRKIFGSTPNLNGKVVWMSLELSESRAVFPPPSIWRDRWMVAAGRALHRPARAAGESGALGPVQLPSRVRARVRGLLKHS